MSGEPTTFDLNRLSKREREVFDLVLKGKRSTEVAEVLGISYKTVESHRNHLNRKLDCHSTIDLIRMAIITGSVTADALKDEATSAAPLKTSTGLA